VDGRLPRCAVPSLNDESPISVAADLTHSASPMYWAVMASTQLHDVYGHYILSVGDSIIAVTNQTYASSVGDTVLNFIDPTAHDGDAQRQSRFVRRDGCRGCRHRAVDGICRDYLGTRSGNRRHRSDVASEGYG